MTAVVADLVQAGGAYAMKRHGIDERARLGRDVCVLDVCGGEHAASRAVATPAAAAAQEQNEQA